MGIGRSVASFVILAGQILAQTGKIVDCRVSAHQSRLGYSFALPRALICTSPLGVFKGCVILLAVVWLVEPAEGGLAMLSVGYAKALLSVRRMEAR